VVKPIYLTLRQVGGEHRSESLERMRSKHRRIGGNRAVWSEAWRNDRRAKPSFNDLQNCTGIAKFGRTRESNRNMGIAVVRGVEAKQKILCRLKAQFASKLRNIVDDLFRGKWSLGRGLRLAFLFACQSNQKLVAEALNLPLSVDHFEGGARRRAQTHRVERELHARRHSRVGPVHLPVAQQIGIANNLSGANATECLDIFFSDAVDCVEDALRVGAVPRNQVVGREGTTCGATTREQRDKRKRGSLLCTNHREPPNPTERYPADTTALNASTTSCHRTSASAAIRIGWSAAKMP
jgi:hypothetical protein